jgi:MoaA/NifB/PqqE/SkfB family radical SAM enzyme
VAPVDEIDTACRAPHTSLHVDQFGDVRPCCQSARVLGNVSDTSLTQIWRGPELAELRAAVDRHDLSLGCEHCAWAGRDRRSETYAARYDHDRLPTPDEGPVRLELAPSNSCNLQCTMCNGDWSSSIRLHREGRPALPRRFGDEQVAQVAALAAGLDELHLFGGEPLLMAEAVRLLEVAAEHELRCVITTNGTVLTPRVEALIDRPGVDLVVSVDGTSPEVYEAIRVGASWSQLLAHLDRFQELAASHGNRVDLAHCLITSNWHEFADHLRWAARRRLEVYVNDVLSPVELSLHHLTPPELGQVLEVLHERDDDVLALGSPWADRWTSTLGHLERTWRDALAGARHEHLGPLTLTTESADAAPDPPLVAALRAQPDRAQRAEVRLELDDQLRVASAHAQGDLDLLGADLDLESLVGRRSAEVTSLQEATGDRTVRSILTWTERLAVEERRFADHGGPVTERRTVDTSGPANELRFEVWRAATVDDQRRAMAELIGPGPLVEFDLDPAGQVVAMGPEAARIELGLRDAVGETCHLPTDVLERPDPPAFRADEVEPGVVAVDLTWPDDRLVGLAIVDADGTHVVIGRPPDAAIEASGS